MRSVLIRRYTKITRTRELFPSSRGKNRVRVAKRTAGIGMEVALCDSQNPMPTPPISDPLMAALLEVAKVRFQLFRERFGRDPEPDEPLLFDPNKGEPTAATQADGRVQVLSAALASEVDAAAVLGLLGYKLSIDA